MARKRHYLNHDASLPALLVAVQTFNEEIAKMGRPLEAYFEIHDGSKAAFVVVFEHGDRLVIAQEAL